jgi:cytochrome b561
MKFSAETFAQAIELMKHSGAQAAPHHWSTKWVHWVAAGLLAFGAIANGDVMGALFDPSAMRTETFVGIGIALLYGYLFFFVRRRGGGSRLPKNSPFWERWLAKSVHFGLYASIVAVLASGFAMAYLARTDLVVNSPAEQILSMTSRFDIIRDFHSGVANILGFLFGLHFVGALWHRFVRCDGVMQSISPLKCKSTE